MRDAREREKGDERGERVCDRVIMRQDMTDARERGLCDI